MTESLKEGVHTSKGVKDLETICLQHSSGSFLEIYLFGAQITKWVVPKKDTTNKDGDDGNIFYISKLSAYGDKSIRGGIPVCFPQFAELGPLPKHGFARISDSWKVTDKGVRDGDVFVQFHLKENDAIKAMGFKQSFSATFVVTLKATELITDLLIENTDIKETQNPPMSITFAFHNYFKADSLAQLSFKGLEGFKYSSKVTKEEGVEKREIVTINGEEVDTVYQIPDSHQDKPIDIIKNASETIRMRQKGCINNVLWNMGKVGIQTLKDMEPGDWDKYFCLESAVVDKPVVLAPGEKKQFQQTLCLIRT